MKTYSECIPCFAGQALDAARIHHLSPADTENLLRKTLARICEVDWNRPPPLIGRDIQTTLKAIMQMADPYRHQKIAQTERALALLPAVTQRIAAAQFPFMEMIRFSIAGNAIDLGAQTSVNTDVGAAFEDALQKALPEESVHELQAAIDNAESVLFLTDNCGEVVFDRPLMEYIGQKKLIIGMRGMPILNDATIHDARMSEIPGDFSIISNGSDIPGTWLTECAPSFVEVFHNADVVIAKGQGNYETLNDVNRSVHHLLLVKCAVIAQDIQCPVGTYVVTKNHHGMTRDQKLSTVSPLRESAANN